MQKLDMTGQPCPIPVVQAKKVLANPAADGVQVLVDNFVAVQNLEKMARGTGCGFSYEQQGEAAYLATLTKEAGALIPAEDTAFTDCAPPAPATGGATVLISGEGMGHGADELGKILIKGFIFSLTELDPPPRAVIFVNGGAQLTSEGANTVPDLQTLAAKGTEVLTCGTCANYYGITEKLAVGAITDMMGITRRLNAATRLITL